MQTGNLLKLSAELYERGILHQGGAHGIEPGWGNAGAFARLMELPKR